MQARLGPTFVSCRSSRPMAWAPPTLSATVGATPCEAGPPPAGLSLPSDAAPSAPPPSACCHLHISARPAATTPSRMSGSWGAPPCRGRLPRLLLLSLQRATADASLPACAAAGDGCTQSALLLLRAMPEALKARRSGRGCSASLTPSSAMLTVAVLGLLCTLPAAPRCSRKLASAAPASAGLPSSALSRWPCLYGQDCRLVMSAPARYELRTST